MKKRTVFLLLFSLLNSPAFSKCTDERLSITLPESATLGQAVTTLAKECHFSVIYSDATSRELIAQKKIGPIEIHRKGIDHVLDILVSRNNLHYTLDEDILTLSHVTTKTFRVDYIDSMRTGNSNTDVIISGTSLGGTKNTATGYGSAGYSSFPPQSGFSSAGGSSSGRTGALITTTESFDFWEDLSQNLQKLIDRPEDGEEKYIASIIIDKKSGLVIASGTKKQLDRVENYIGTVLDSLQKQVIIDVQIIGVTLDRSHTLGIDWSRLSLDLGLTGSLLSSKDDTTLNGTRTLTESESIVVDRSAGLQMNGFFNFLQQYGETKSISNPKVLAINNQPSMISVGDNINYLIKESTSTATTSTVVTESSIPASLFVGVLLDITPQIDAEEFITLRINPSISELKYSQDAIKQSETRTLPPDTVTRRISSVVRVKNGDSIILGGLISTTKGTVENKVRLLGDIPYLGRLFKSTATTDIVTEIIFVLTPHLADPNNIPTLAELGFESPEHITGTPRETKISQQPDAKADVTANTIPHMTKDTR